MRLAGWAIVGFALAVFVAAIARLDALQQGDPPHIELVLEHGVPATLFLPGKGNPFFNPPAQVPEPRPPSIVLLHGFAADRAMMSALARRLARNGFAVCAIDLRGHGANRNPFSPEFAGDETLYADIKDAVDFMRTSPYADGSRLAVIGHSMGAQAALDYASRDPYVAGTVMISGGWSLLGPGRPHNTLFIYAAHDPDTIRGRAGTMASQLAGTKQLQIGKLYGKPSAGSAVRAVSVAGTDHLSILFSADAAREIIQWLDAIFGTAPRQDLDLRSPRMLPVKIAFAAFLVLLLAVGETVGRIAPTRPRRADGINGLFGLGALAIVLAIAMPLVSSHPPAYFLSLDLGDVAFSWLGVAGAVLLAALAARGQLEDLELLEQPVRTALAALFGVAAVYIMMVPFGPVFHRLALTPERLVAAILSAVILTPFFLAFEVLLRRGGIAASTLLGMFGRALIVAFLMLGVWTGVMPAVVTLMIPVLAVLFVMLELVAAATYQACGNLAAIALIEASWLAFATAATMPIRMKIG